jgi:hypothetical protein
MAKRKHKEMRMTIRWVPGHEGVPGNEEADRTAKQAIEEGSSPEKELPAPLRKGLPRGRAAMQRAIQETLKARAEKVWQQSPRYGRMKGIDESMPSKKFAKLAAELPRKKASLLIQLRSGHVPLQAHLHRITRADSPTCQGCGARKETVHHFLMVCPKYMAQRQQMAAEGGRGTLVMARLLSSSKLTRHLFDYIARTKRFEDTFGDIDVTQ